MKTILFLTSSYPYPPGEQFIENEISYWSNLPETHVVLVPSTANGKPRRVPQDIFIDLTIAKQRKLITKIRYVLKSLLSSIFLKEILFLKKIKKLSAISLFDALKTVALTEQFRDALRTVCVNYEKIDIAYCYWNGPQAYAAALLKDEKLINRIASRAHGSDLYEERCRNNYMPVKRQFSRKIDLFLAISNQGSEYLHSVYGVEREKIKVSRLGVIIPEKFCKTSDGDRLNILSVSFCVPVKRVDKIIKSIKIASCMRKDIAFNWVHIGGGPLLETLRDLAEDLLESPNVSYEFCGVISNENVKKYFNLNPVDIFLNASESEGVPVSIMEAMSYGVPAIAPNVGGISEIIDDSCGKLMSKNPSVDEIAESIISVINDCKAPEFRIRVKEMAINKYSANRNYGSLKKILLKLCDS